MSIPEPPPTPAAYPYAYGQPGSDPPLAPGGSKRPGTVLAAGIITIVFSVLTLAGLAIGLVGLSTSRDALVDELESSPGLEDFDVDQLVGLITVVIAVLAVWCLAAIVLAVFAMRGSPVARVLLVVSAAASALLSLLAILSLVSALTLVAAISVIVLLFTGGAGPWYAGRGGSATAPPPTALS